ncbi:DinB family protein [Rhizobium nepotum]|uniref:DinB family protein n=1 Tax=Rhizobium nepotum TaxID=1035271 RepID=UPI003369CA24
MPEYDSSRVFRKLARNNRLANFRLHHACLRLSKEEFVAPRVSFFPTLRATLNHIYTVDRFYIDAVKGGTLGLDAFAEEEPFATMAELRIAQAELDEALIAFVDRLDGDGLAATVNIHRGKRIQQDRCDDVLSHLFQHQTHHRGQAHAMLSGTMIGPPQLDEFIVGDDAKARKAEMDALGWTEADLMFPARRSS